MRSPKLVSALLVLSLAAAPAGVALAHGPGDGYVPGGGSGNMMPMMMSPYMMGQAAGQMPMGRQMGPQGMMPGGAQRGPMGPGMGTGQMGTGQMGPGQMGPGQMGAGQMGPGQMGYGHMGYGQMGPGGAMMMYGGGAYPWLGWRVLPPLNLTADDVRHVLEARIADLGNKRLKLGDVRAEKDDRIVADIVTEDNSLVERLSVDAHTGVIEYVQ